MQRLKAVFLLFSFSPRCRSNPLFFSFSAQKQFIVPQFRFRFPKRWSLFKNALILQSFGVV
ncbi:hypothetical protein HanXRQr2_Chr08g0328561 [Helianthus annuus]|uniref:Uncharacterized protein n=1 Tax=Helianthus annuus TaxID=4232 RepID=A0A251U3H0_HELAN|nr:hypothetical protein HanXRQr2_Chr08g0328561 [Helianthus annuus]KAJ0900776.1 hypothetical protein HanPSC8_Chr08g0317601 [Helianthus annuus]